LQTTSTQKGQIGTIAKFAAIFNPADCEAIAKIRPPSRRTEDFVAWKAEESGLFSVRSTYNIDLTEQTREISVALSAHPEGERKLWGDIWKCQVPPKN